MADLAKVSSPLSLVIPPWPQWNDGMTLATLTPRACCPLLSGAVYWSPPQPTGQVQAGLASAASTAAPSLHEVASHICPRLNVAVLGTRVTRVSAACRCVDVPPHVIAIRRPLMEEMKSTSWGRNSRNQGSAVEPIWKASRGAHRWRQRVYSISCLSFFSACTKSSTRTRNDLAF